MIGNIELCVKSVLTYHYFDTLGHSRSCQVFLAISGHSSYAGYFSQNEKRRSVIEQEIEKL